MNERIVQVLATSLTEGAIYGLVALGLVIILRSTGALFFAQGAIAMAGGVMMHWLFGQHGIPLVFSIPASLTICVAMSVLSLRLIVLPLLARRANILNVSIATIGVNYLFEMAAMLIFGKQPLAVPSFSGDEPVTFLGASFIPQHFWIIGLAAAALALALVFFKGTWMGKAMTALGDNPLLAKASGFPVTALFMYSFVFASLVAGVAGIAIAPMSYAGYNVGMRLTVKAFIGASIGGITNPLGAVLGGCILGFFESFTAGFVSSRLKDLITFVLLLIVLRLRPQGLFGRGD